MSDYNTERARYKAAKRQPAPDTPPPAKRKQVAKGSRPFEVWRKARRLARYRVTADGTRVLDPITAKPYKVGAWKTREEAQAYIDKRSRGVYVRERHYPAGTPVDEGELQRRQAELRDTYFIKENGK